MAAISFDDIEITDDQRLDVSARVTHEGGEQTHHLWFETNASMLWDLDRVAIALSTLCGRAYEQVHFDLPLQRETRDRLVAFTQAEVTCHSHPTADGCTAQSGAVLNFSGGFDSLAALALMPEDTHLVSLDFGGRFSRERAYYQRFEPTIISTNLTETPLRANSWSFMGIGAILTAAHHHARYMTFGSILEAGVDNMRTTPVSTTSGTFPPFAAAGYTNAPYVAGLTEIGTVIALAHYMPEQIPASLTSLASPGEEKLYRKYLLTKVVANRLDTPATAAPEIQAPGAPHYQWGQNFATDFLSLYVAKHAGPDARDTMVSDTPPEVDAAVADLTLTFFEKANTTVYQAMPTPLLGGLVEKLTDAGIGLYTESDWDEYRAVRQLLAPYYPAVLS
ncbi:hypothetical protein [Kocuria sp. CPCC 205297]|uniref:hypothetical protein n=1 Tax=Kocuria sp. CPCC 205297 TaxID=3073558 RepID=UPI0034D4511F